VEKLSDNILVWADLPTLEEEAKTQIFNVAEMPFLFRNLAIMPDCHTGYGIANGSVIATRGAIMPAAVGFDIGCGMIAVKTKFLAKDLPDNLPSIRDGIQQRIPLGAGRFNQKLTESAAARVGHLQEVAKDDYGQIDGRWPLALGTLGSGNHFIEICLDENDQVWVVLHSGSRGIGHKLAEKHIKIAQRLMDDFFIPLKDKDLAYLPEKRPEFQAYIRDLLWAQDFALANREEMMDRVMTELSYALFDENGHQLEIELERINCHHNFTQQEHHFGQNVWITRKGAIQMRKGQLGVIPGSMGTRSYIVSGLENRLSYHSAPHGAGRRLSRTEARRRFTEEDLKETMEGITYRHSPALIEEIKDAYKDIDEVMKRSKDLVTILHVLRQIVNVKGD
jgi:tRNA-splicing ligase RtcB